LEIVGRSKDRIAAAICDVNANVLAGQKKTGDPTCTAKNSTSALQSAVQKKLGTVTNNAFSGGRLRRPSPGR
jgi:hypothetical protein